MAVGTLGNEIDVQARNLIVRLASPGRATSIRRKLLNELKWQYARESSRSLRKLWRARCKRGCIFVWKKVAMNYALRKFGRWPEKSRMKRWPFVQLAIAIERSSEGLTASGAWKANVWTEGRHARIDDEWLSCSTSMS